jgi:hypothetical protein
MSVERCELKHEPARPRVSGPKSWLSDDGSGERGRGPILACNFGDAQELVKSGDDLTNELVDKRSRRSISRRKCDEHTAPVSRLELASRL